MCPNIASMNTFVTELQNIYWLSYDGLKGQVRLMSYSGYWAYFWFKYPFTMQMNRLQNGSN